MSQKINSVNLRLKKRLNWNNIISSQNFKDYGFLSYRSNELQQLTKIVLKKFNYYNNNNLILKDSKNFRFYSKIINDLQILKDLISINGNPNYSMETEKNKRMEYLKSKKERLKQLNIQRSNIILNCVDLLKIKNDNIIKLDNQQTGSMAIWPDLITNYIKKQMNEPNSRKNKFFNMGLQLGITKMIQSLITNELWYWSKTTKTMKKYRWPFENIIGLKFEVRGRWKKTKSGRKQRIKLNIGQTQLTGINTVAFFSFISEKTKYASCGFKLWIIYKSKRF